MYLLHNINGVHLRIRKQKKSCENLLQVMSDSPNVMRGKHKGVLKLIKDSHAPHLLDLGGCSLHHISSTVVYATKEF